MELSEVLDGLVEGYGRYRELLEQAGGAIERRDAGTLTVLESGCRTILVDLQTQWRELEFRLGGESPPELRAIPALHRLRQLIEHTRDLAAGNEASLDQWLGEVGIQLSTARSGKRAVQGYHSEGNGLRRLLSANA